MKVITAGRNQENDLVINDAKASRYHLQIVQDDSGNFSVVDLNSKNGTFLNGRQITGETRIKLGDEIRVNDTVLAWRQFFEPAENPPAKRNIWKWIAAAGAILIVVAGVVAVIVFLGMKSKKDELTKRLEDTQMALNLYTAADKNLQDAILLAQQDSTAENRKRLEEAQREYDQAQAGWERTNAQHRTRIYELIDNQIIVSDENKEMLRQRDSLEEQLKSRKDSIAILTKSLEDLQKITRLTTDFYVKLSQLEKLKNADEVIRGIIAQAKKEDKTPSEKLPKDALVDIFNGSLVEEKEAIIGYINAALALAPTNNQQEPATPPQDEK